MEQEKSGHTLCVADLAKYFTLDYIFEKDKNVYKPQVLTEQIDFYKFAENKPTIVITTKAAAVFPNIL